MNVEYLTIVRDEDGERHPQPAQGCVQGPRRVFSQIEKEAGLCNELQCLGALILDVHTEKRDLVAETLLCR